MSPWIIAAAVLVILLLAWNLRRRFGTDQIEALNEKRRPGSRLVGRGELVDGNRHLQVALAVNRSTFFYENDDLEGSLDLQSLREVEIDDELATGTMPPSGRVLRLRTNSQMFEFVVPAESASQWQSLLPMGEPLRPGVGSPKDGAK